MINPFSEKQVREGVDLPMACRPISFFVRVAEGIKIFTNVNTTVHRDPKNFDERSFV